MNASLADGDSGAVKLSPAQPRLAADREEL
jgi:hypothetical protein